MPGTTSYNPCLAANVDCRHRLGCTEVGAEPLRNEYTSLSHTTRPSAALMTHGDKAAINPRSASSKSVVSCNGSTCPQCADSMTAVGGLWSTGITLPLTALRPKAATSAK